MNVSVCAMRVCFASICITRCQRAPAPTASSGSGAATSRTAWRTCSTICPVPPASVAAASIVTSSESPRADTRAVPLRWAAAATSVRKPSAMGEGGPEAGTPASVTRQRKSRLPSGETPCGSIAITMCTGGSGVSGCLAPASSVDTLVRISIASSSFRAGFQA